MARVETYAIVLRRIPYMETSELIYWLTPEHGIVHSLAKGIHRPRSPFRGPVDLLDLCTIAYNDHRQGEGLVVLSRLEPRHRWRGLRSDAVRLRAALSGLELVRELVQPEQEAAAMFAAFCSFLDCLAGSDRAGFVLAWFRARSLTICGHRPELGRCARCGASAAGALVDYAEGGVLCASCRAARTGLARFSAATRELLAAMCGAEEPAEMLASHPPLSLNGGRELRRFLRDYTRYVLDKSLKMDT